MKRIKAVLALLLFMHSGIAQADMQLFVAEGTISAQQAQALARHLSEALDEPVELALQEEDGRSFSERIMDGGGMDLAIAGAGEMKPWIKEGLIAPLDGLAHVVNADEGETAACVADERLYGLPLLEKARCMAVSADFMEEIRMSYLLDGRNYPAWYPTQVLQVLDELALLGNAGMELWPAKEENSLFLEAFLQGVGGEWFTPDTVSAHEADMQAMEDALIWLGDMTRAGLIGAAENREQALERFISAQTAIFIDWSAKESQAYAEAIRSGEIVLLPFPSAEGLPHRAAQVVCVCAMRTGDEAAQEQARRAAALIAAKMDGMKTSSAQHMPASGAAMLCALETLEDGATLRRLVCEATAGILSGGEDARAAAQRIVRALDAAAR